MHVLNSGMPVIVLDARLLYSSCRPETCTKGNKLELDRSLVQDESSMNFLYLLIYLPLQFACWFQTPKRVRVGIGRPNDRHHVTAYVLRSFEPSEIPVIQDTIEQCCKVLMNELQSLMSQSSDCQDIGPPNKDTVQYQLQLWINHKKCKKKVKFIAEGQKFSCLQR